MADDPSPGALPQHFAVRLEHGGHTHYIICEAVVSFDENTLFDSGAKALRDMFSEFSRPGAVEVAVLPPPGTAGWMFHAVTMQSADDDP